MPEKTIICLANSYKHGGRCVAGREVAVGGVGPWIRPVSAREGHEIQWNELICTDLRALEVLDIARVSLIRQVPFEHQPENHLLAGNGNWTRLGRASWDQVRSCQDEDAFDTGFWDDFGDTSHGSADKVGAAEALRIGTSLRLICLPQVQMLVGLEDGYNKPPTRKVRVQFTYRGVDYVLKCTDPIFDAFYLRGNDGAFVLAPAAICVSLSEVFRKTGDAYRLAASIITPQRCGAVA